MNALEIRNNIADILKSLGWEQFQSSCNNFIMEKQFKCLGYMKTCTIVLHNCDDVYYTLQAEYFSQGRNIINPFNFIKHDIELDELNVVVKKYIKELEFVISQTYGCKLVGEQ